MLMLIENLEILFGVTINFVIYLGVIKMSLISELKAIKATLTTATLITEEKVGDIVAKAIKPTQDTTAELVAFTGLDEDKPAPSQPVTQPSTQPVE
jgi:hypothetical protein